MLERDLAEPQDAGPLFPRLLQRDSTFVTLNITGSALACAAHSSGILYLDIIKG